jgi:hypothetical protein
MGIAKSIEAYGIYHYYSPDINIFLSKLAELTASNFEVTLLDLECDMVYENKLFDFGNKQTLPITILQSEYQFQNTKLLLPSYTLKYPIIYEYEHELEIDFHPNQVCNVVFLTFEHLWKTFIEVLRFKIHEKQATRQLSIDRYNTLRSEYSRILKSLKIESILIITHANYKIVELVEPEKYNVPEFQNILEEAVKMDDFTIFDFEEILFAENRNQLPVNFLILDELKIAFRDNMTNL